MLDISRISYSLTLQGVGLLNKAQNEIEQITQNCLLSVDHRLKTLKVKLVYDLSNNFIVILKYFKPYHRISFNP